LAFPGAAGLLRAPWDGLATAHLPETAERQVAISQRVGIVMVPRSHEQGAPADAVYQLRKSDAPAQDAAQDDLDDGDIEDVTDARPEDGERH